MSLNHPNVAEASSQASPHRQSRHVRGRLEELRKLCCSVVMVTSTLTASTGNASPSKKECARSFEAAQEEYARGKLLHARELLRSCFHEVCGEVMAQACTELQDEIASETPSIVVSLADARGASISRADVRLDGELVATRIDGQALSVDPGLHLIALATPDGRTVERRVAVLQGRASQEVAFQLAAGAPATPKPAGAPEPPARGSSALPYLFGGLGAAGVGGFALLAHVGGKQERRLQACWPHCDEAQVQRVRNTYWAANASLGVGIAALATGLVLALQAGPTRDEPRRTPTPKPRAYSFELAPSLAGVSATVSGSF